MDFFILKPLLILIDDFQHGPPVLGRFPVDLFVRDALKQVREHVVIYLQMLFNFLMIHN